MGNVALEAMYYWVNNRDGCRVPVWLHYKPVARMGHLGLFRHAF